MCRDPRVSVFAARFGGAQGSCVGIVLVLLEVRHT